MLPSHIYFRRYMLIRFFLFFIIYNLITDTAFACAEDIKELPEIVARINNIAITRAELKSRISQSRSMNPELFDSMNSQQKRRSIERALNNMIVRELEFQEAQKQGIAVKEDEVEQRLSELKRRYKGDLHQALENFKITLPKWKEETRKNILIEKLEKTLYSRIPVSNDEVLQEFTLNYWKGKDAPPKKELDEHRDHMRLIIQQRKWIEGRRIWLRSLINASQIWRCSSEESLITSP